VPSSEHFVVGRVLEAVQHPDADRLRVCTVDIGSSEPATIVCGAPNVAASQTVAVALPGATMPGGMKIKRAKLRGVVSEGMILSEAELQIGPGGEGILVLDQFALDAEFAPGAPLDELLPIGMDVLELEITPNRPDCLGVYGVARELHAASGATLSGAPWAADPGSPAGEPLDPPGAVEIRVECPDLCPRFTARVFENVSIGPSPPWLKARLTAAGQRPINNVVDITNYAMLLSGQPLHAFDLDRVAGRTLTVRRAHAGERVDTLDGQTRTLDSEMVLIEDAEGPTSIAGLMGGARSEVQPHTTRVLLESATWNGPNIHRSSWDLGLRSEASSRFEKGLQPEQCMHAQAVASRLMLELCGALLVRGTIDIGGEGPAAQVIGLREDRVRGILGVSVSGERQSEILRALDFQTEPVSDGLDVTVPALRRDDVTREIDLIEEVARIEGVDRLPATLPARRGAAGMLSHPQRVRRAAEDALVGRGLYEIIGWSFADRGLLDRLRIPAGHEMRNVVEIENPLSDAQSILRPSLLGSLLDAARHNAARDRPDIQIFESGTVYRAAPAGPLADEHHALGALMTGRLAPISWRGEPGQADFFAAKALLGALLDKLGVSWSVEPAGWPFLHPGRSAAVLAGAERLGFIGEVHPLVAEAWDLGRTAAFAIDVGKLSSAAPPVVAFRAFPAVPSLRRDLAVVLPEAISAAQTLERVRAAAGEILDDVGVFDVYTGQQIGEGMRSLALSLSFRSAERTLTDEEIAPVRARIVEALGELGGVLRG
jgi:phenylalanyl-tRNA synthetase beta chain